MSTGWAVFWHAASAVVFLALLIDRIYLTRELRRVRQLLSDAHYLGGRR